MVIELEAVKSVRKGEWDYGLEGFMLKVSFEPGVERVTDVESGDEGDNELVWVTHEVTVTGRLLM